MKITIFTFGTRGDVQPFLGLAVGLQRSGHQVTLAAPCNFTDWIQSYGVQTHPISWSSSDFLKDPELQVALQSRNPMRAFRVLRDVMEPVFIRVNDEFWKAGEDTEFVVQTMPLICAVEVAQHRGLPMANAYFGPIYVPPTRAFPAFALPWQFSWGGGYNYLTYKLLQQNSGLLRPLNEWRASRLRLPPLRSSAEILNISSSSGTPSLYGYSPTVLPKPVDWDETHQVTGYWFLDSPPDFQPSADLLRFLESGSPPIYVGFGSMSDRDPERLARLTLRALEATGQRGVLETSWRGVKQLSSSADVYYLDENVPHDWLFPRMAAVVHHGGAGTASAGLRAGIPSIVAPFMLDQYAWANLVAKLDVGLRVVRNVKKLTAEKLSRAINTVVNDASMRIRAATLGEKIRAENGIAHAVETIERHAADFHRRVKRKS